MRVNILFLAIYLSFVVLCSARCCSDPPTTPRPSRAPTILPTRLPSEVPTRKPSQNPTPMPSRLPSIVPTRRPSRAPTIEPSETPSEEPTYEPSQPSSQPSSTPTTLTPRPTYKPSLYPTPLPSYTPQPSVTPTIIPTKTPSQLPSKTPSNGPSMAPTRSPSSAPSTIAPSTQPTVTPSITPSTYPSNSPTLHPTESPTISLGPTESPSVVPSKVPTFTPTEVPSTAPSFSPSVRPSTQPTFNPTTSVAYSLRMQISQVLVNIDAATFQNSSANFDAFTLAVSSTVDLLERTDVVVITATDTAIRLRRYLRESSLSMQLSATVPEVNVEYAVSFVVQEQGFVDGTQASEYVQSRLRAAVDDGTFAANLASAAGNVSGAEPALRNVTAGALTFLSSDIIILRSAAPTTQPTITPGAAVGGVTKSGFSAWPQHLKAITIFFAVLGFLLVALAVFIWRCADCWGVVCLYCMVSGASLFHKDLCEMVADRPTATNHNDVVTSQPKRSDLSVTEQQQQISLDFANDAPTNGPPISHSNPHQSETSDPGASSRTILPPEPTQNPPSFLGFISSALSQFLPFGPIDSAESDEEDDTRHQGATSRNSLDGSVVDEEAQWTAPGEILVDETELPGLHVTSTDNRPSKSGFSLTHPDSIRPASNSADADGKTKPKKSPFQSLQSILTEFLRPNEDEVPAEVDVNLSDTYPALSDGTVPMQSAPQPHREALSLELEPEGQFSDELALTDEENETIDIPEPTTPPRSILKSSATLRESPRTSAFSRMPRVAFRLSSSSTPRASMDGSAARPALESAPSPAPTTTHGGTLLAMVSSALGLLMPFGAEELVRQEQRGDEEQDQTSELPSAPHSRDGDQSDEFTERIMSSYRPAPGGESAPKGYSQRKYPHRMRTAVATNNKPHSAAIPTIAANTKPTEETIVINLSSEPAKKSRFNPFRYFAHGGAATARLPSKSASFGGNEPIGGVTTSTKEYISTLTGMHPSLRTSAPLQPQKNSNTSLMQPTEDSQQSEPPSTGMGAANNPSDFPPRPPVAEPDSRKSFFRGPSDIHHAPSVDLRRQYADAPPRVSIRTNNNSNSRSPRRSLQTTVPSNASGGDENGQHTASLGFSKPKSLPAKK